MTQAANPTLAGFPLEHELRLARAKAFIDSIWESDILPALTDYIRIPNKSPAFDPDWEAHGHMERAVALLSDWARAKLATISGATLEIARLPGRTPVILIEIPASAGHETAAPTLLYGHLDKQPEMTGWNDGLGPWEPVRRGDRLYGRGGADDGYSLFGVLAAILALRDQGLAHRRAIILIEASEESGSVDLPAHIAALADRIGTPELIVCLDSGCGNYDQLWLTTSLRGLMTADLTIRMLHEGVHSGDAAGIVPSSFRILRTLLARLEDQETGAILPQSLQVEIPPDRQAESERAAAALGPALYEKFPFAQGAQPVTTDPVQLLLNRTWRPQLEIIGLDGLPPPDPGRQCAAPLFRARISLRLPPTLAAARPRPGAVKTLLEPDPPHGASVRFDVESAMPAGRARARAVVDRGGRAGVAIGFGQPAA